MLTTLTDKDLLNELWRVHIPLSIMIHMFLLPRVILTTSCYDTQKI